MSLFTVYQYLHSWSCVSSGICCFITPKFITISTISLKILSWYGMVLYLPEKVSSFSLWNSSFHHPSFYSTYFHAFHCFHDSFVALFHQTSSSVQYLSCVCMSPLTLTHSIIFILCSPHFYFHVRMFCLFLVGEEGYNNCSTHIYYICHSSTNLQFSLMLLGVEIYIYL